MTSMNFCDKCNRYRLCTQIRITTYRLVYVLCAECRAAFYDANRGKLRNYDPFDDYIELNPYYTPTF